MSFFIHNALDFYYFLNLDSLLITILKYTISVAALYFAGFRVFKNKLKFTLQFSSILFIFLFFGAFTDMSDKYFHLDKIEGYYTILVAVFFTACAIIILTCAWLKAATLHLLIKFWAIYCVAFSAYDICKFLISPNREKKYLSASNKINISPKAEKIPVFFFVFDMYPSNYVLHKYMEFENSQLTDFLKQKDFFVAENSQAAYVTTYYSLSSTLNLDLLNFYEDTGLEAYKKQLVAIKNIENNDLISGFEKAGYAFRNFSIFDIKDQPSPLEYSMPYLVGNILTSTTFFDRIDRNTEPAILLARKNIDIRFLKESRGNLIKRDFKKLDTILNKVADMYTTANKPGFNYFHFMIPHPPAAYDSIGNETDVREMYATNDYKKSIEIYKNYLIYGNKKIKQMVNKIFDKAGKNVIIIIQGDHGYREFSGRFPDEVRYGIFNAVYLPNKNYTNFNDTISPINTFKQILKNQFDTAIK